MRSFQHVPIISRVQLPQAINNECQPSFLAKDIPPSIFLLFWKKSFLLWLFSPGENTINEIYSLLGRKSGLMVSKFDSQLEGRGFESHPLPNADSVKAMLGLILAPYTGSFNNWNIGLMGQNKTKSFQESVNLSKIICWCVASIYVLDIWSYFRITVFWHFSQTSAVSRYRSVYFKVQCL